MYIDGLTVFSEATNGAEFAEYIDQELSAPAGFKGKHTRALISAATNSPFKIKLGFCDDNFKLFSAKGVMIAIAYGDLVQYHWILGSKTEEIRDWEVFEAYQTWRTGDALTTDTVKYTMPAPSGQSIPNRYKDRR